MWRRLKAWRTELRNTFTGTGDRVPQWTQELAEGEDPGYFGPGSAVWAVHGGMPTLIAGIRALLIQSLHPAAMAGVHEYSMYRQDPLRRLAGTIRWIFTVTYGDTAAAQRASEQIRRLHQKVHGTYVNAAGQTVPYSAEDPQALRWVHLAFTDSFLAAHRQFGGPIPGGPDRYVAEWATAGELMQVPFPPTTLDELQQQLHSFDTILERTDLVTDAVGFLRHPPLPASQRLGYRVLFAAAVATLEPRHRDLLGLRPARLGPLPLPVKTAARAVLAVVRLGLGGRGPSETAARDRIARLHAS